MVTKPYMSALLLFHSKITLIHKRSEAVAIAELKVWQIPKSKSFPEGIKYSLFLVHKTTGQVLVGYDNHKPKGHHVHIDDAERPYTFKDVSSLIDDFWTTVEKRGYLIE